MRALSVDEQDRLLRQYCPQFRLVAHSAWIGVWEGTLRPICQEYRVRIVYYARKYFQHFTLTNHRISIFVLDPEIGPDPRGTGEPLQHVYRLGHPPNRPALCIFDPREDNWQPSEPIHERYIPWAIKWLFFHEDWVDTGVWRGGGRHPEIPQAPRGSECLTQESSNPENPGLPARSLSDEFFSLGRRIGVFASCLSMAAASVESSRLPSWQDLNVPTPAEVQSEITSILSLEPRPAEYWRLDLGRGTPRTNSSSFTQSEAAKSFLPSQITRSAA
jgi:hypothetical protein